MRRLLFTLALCLAALGCSTQPTEVMLVVDGEFDTPSEIDHIDVTITAPSTATVTSTATFDATNPGFPRTLGIVQGVGGSGSYVVDVVGKLGTTTVIRRRASFRFSTNQVRMLRVDLLRDCVAVNCASDRTCSEGGLCDRIDVSTTPWHGAPSTQFDAGAASSPIVAP